MKANNEQGKQLILKKLLFARDLEKARTSVWVKEKNMVASNIYENISFEMYQSCRNPERRVKRYFMMNDQSIFYSKKQGSPLAGKIDLHNTYVAFDPDDRTNIHESEKVHTIFIRKQSKVVALYMSNQSIFNKWMNKLRGLTICLDFYDVYKVKKLIGRGAFAKVYQIENRLTGEQFAVKAFHQLNPNISSDKGQRSLLQEIEIQKSLSHPSVMKVYQLYESESSFCIVVQMINGGDMVQRIKSLNPALTLADIRVFMTNLLQTVDYMHTKLVMHRDLKPENILIRTKNELEIVIGDFGLAERLDREFVIKQGGTPGYVAPEIFKYQPPKERYTEKCDIFSLGCIFYACYTGRSPFQGDNYNETLELNIQGQFDTAKALSLNIPEKAVDLMSQMLRQNYQERVSAAEALTHIYFQEKAENEMCSVSSIKPSAEMDVEQEQGPESMMSQLGLIEKKFIKFHSNSSSMFVEKEVIWNGKSMTFKEEDKLIEKDKQGASNTGVGSGVGNLTKADGPSLLMNLSNLGNLINTQQKFIDFEENNRIQREKLEKIRSVKNSTPQQLNKDEIAEDTDFKQLKEDHQSEQDDNTKNTPFSQLSDEKQIELGLINFYAQEPVCDEEPSDRKLQYNAFKLLSDQNNTPFSNVQDLQENIQGVIIQSSQKI